MRKNFFIIVFALILFLGPVVISSTSPKISEPTNKEINAGFLNSHTDPEVAISSNHIPPIHSMEKISGKLGQIKTGSPNQPTPANYDEQLGITFAQSFSTLAYNVTAVEQSDSYGYGPAYLLNGLSDQGYWYQVGLSWNWPLLNGSYNAGFSMNYEVFNSTGQSVFPVSNGSGIVSYSGAVNEGNIILLNLYILNGQVIMYSKDWNTGATASENYSAQGSTTFVGLTGQTANSNGFFTGLMTEEYQVSAYYGSETQVTYSDPGFALTSAIMWADEYNANTSQVLFNAASSQLTYDNPDLFQYFSSNGTSESSDAYTFITGAAIPVSITLSYSVTGGGSGYSAPTVMYVSDGVEKTANLSLQATSYDMDSGSTWSVTNPLDGSNSTERWFTAQATEETVTAPENISLVYSNEFVVSVSPNPISGGSTVPSGSSWYEADSLLNITAHPVSPNFFLGWNSTVSSSELDFQNISSIATTVSINGSGDIFADFAAIGLTLSSDAGSVTQGASGSFVANVKGPSGALASLSVSGLPENATASFPANPIFLFSNGANTSVSILVGLSTPPGNYSLTLTATDTVNGGNGSTAYVLTVKQAVSLTFAYSTSDNSTSSGPILNFMYNGENKSVSIGTSQQVFYADLGTSWNIQNLLPGSNASVQWITDQMTSGTATDPISLNFTYYHQYLLNFEYQIIGGGIPNSPPLVSFTSLGSNSSLAATPSGREAWVDALSSYSYVSTITDTSTSERWQIENNSLVPVTGNFTADPSYYYQFLVPASFEVTGGGTDFAAPVLSYESLGSSENYTLGLDSQELWIDSGSSWSAPPQLNGSSAQERWVASYGPNLTATVSSADPLVLSYETQYYVSIGLSTPAAGSVQPSNGWYNSSQSITISSEPSAGWQFSTWEGSNTTSSPNFTTQVNGPISETAVYNAGVVVRSGDNGKLTFSDGSYHGSVAAGSSKTIYVPLGTSVTFDAFPASLFYSVRSWNIANDSTSAGSPSYSMTVESPSSVGVTFEYNYLILGTIGASAAAGVLSYVMLSLRKRLGTVPSPTSESSTEDPEDTD